jgi:predicted Zn-dependent protease
LSGGIKWRSFPVTYAIDPASSGLDPAATRNAVVKAFTEFDNQYPGQLFVLTNDFNNAKIKVQWKPIDGSLKTIGYTSYSYKLSSKELISTTITFDRGDGWFVSGVERCTSFGSALDIQNVAMHEIGHAVGLGHVGDRLQSMYSTSFTGETLKRSLGNGDKIGFDFLY